MPGKIKNEKSPHDDILEEITSINIIMWTLTFIYNESKYSLQGTTQGNGLTGGVPPVRFSM